jgi:hypothetical protein
MTAQARDILRFEGRELRLFSNPLEQLWGPTRRRPRFVPTYTFLWRGYVATWSIESGILYLTGISGLVYADERGNPLYNESDFLSEPLGVDRYSVPTRPASVALLFPGAGDRVRAEWFTGELRVPEGELVHYVHMGYQSVFDREMRIYLERGLVIGSEVVETGETFRRELEALNLRRERPLSAKPGADGWLTCPHCGRRFTVSDKLRWNGERHACGGRIHLHGTTTD